MFRLFRLIQQQEIEILRNTLLWGPARRFWMIN